MFLKSTIRGTLPDSTSTENEAEGGTGVSVGAGVGIGGTGVGVWVRAKMGVEIGTLVVDVVVGVACNFVSRVEVEDVSGNGV